MTQAPTKNATNPSSPRRTSRVSIRPDPKSSSRSPKDPSAPRVRASPPTSPCPAAISSCSPTPINPASRARSKATRNASASRRSPRTEHPRWHGRHHPHRRRGPAQALLHPRPRVAARGMESGAGTIKKQPIATCVFQEPDLIERTVRDFLTEDVERIVMDSPKFEYMQTPSPEDLQALRPQGQLLPRPQPIFDRFGISASSNPPSHARSISRAAATSSSTKPRPSSPSTSTPAPQGRQGPGFRHPQGQPRGRRGNLPPTPPPQHGRLHRARFHRHEIRRDQQQVYQRMKDGLRRDKAKTHILPISQLGLMEMTRQRHTESVRPPSTTIVRTAKAAARSRAPKP
jgi:hypothetical protein